MAFLFFATALPMKKFLRIPKMLRSLHEVHAHRVRHALHNDPRYADERSLIPFGNKVYSQSDEDGIIAEIFGRIGTTNKVFVEFGIGNGLENNTLALIFQGWSGLWIEGSQKHTRQIRKNLPKTLASGKLKLINDFITRDNIDSLISGAISESVIDLLSVDIDGNDFHVLEAVKCIDPRVLVTEYNAKFAPPIRFCLKYNESHMWTGNDCYGVSLKFLEVELRKKGYSLVACSLTGNNAFFVKEELAADKFLTPFTAENHYEPPRFFLASITAGHRASYETVENIWPNS